VSHVTSAAVYLYFCNEKLATSHLSSCTGSYFPPDSECIVHVCISLMQYEGRWDVDIAAEGWEMHTKCGQRTKEVSYHLWNICNWILEKYDMWVYTANFHKHGNELLGFVTPCIFWPPDLPLKEAYKCLYFQTWMKLF